jgi:hypothetical protein
VVQFTSYTCFDIVTYGLTGLSTWWLYSKTVSWFLHLHCKWQESQHV